jgi:hypothetical protein
MGMTIFVSYARKDQVETDWLERLRYYLAAFRNLEAIDLWDDSRITSGADWQREILRAIESANAAILLVGPGFLGSSFIRDYELPAVLSRARDSRGFQVYPLIIMPCPYAYSELASMQAFNSPDRPLEGLSYHEQNVILNRLGTTVAQLSGAVASRTTAISTVCMAMRQIYDCCEIGRTIYERQNAKTGRLLERVRSRLDVEHMDFEPFFLRYYEQMNDLERADFAELRRITQGPIREGNLTVFNVLSQNPVLFSKVPELTALQVHLTFWLKKFDSVFTQNERRCVCYATEEDSVPWPYGIQQKVLEWLATNCQHS